jgi:adenylyltransferase/sulfurtransferase
MGYDARMDDLSRYDRQMLLEGIGAEGQRRLAGSSALLVGCGALGGLIAESLVRAGVGRLRIVDRDVVESTNLQRQALFDESDAAEGAPKAVAAARRLHAVNSRVRIEPVVADFTAANAQSLAAGVDAILDGTDNLETRWLLNDLAVRRGLPYVYGGAVGTQGLAYVVRPGSACLRCVFDDAASAGGPTCDTVGVLGPMAWVIASIQAAEAIKLLSGNAQAVNRRMVSIDLWAGTFRVIDVQAAHRPGECECCGLKKFSHLHGGGGSGSASLCGRNAVQVKPLAGGFDLEPVARRLENRGPIVRNEHLLRTRIQERGRAFEMTLFADGRAIIHGTGDTAEARAIYARYVGS